MSKQLLRILPLVFLMMSMQACTSKKVSSGDDVSESELSGDASEDDDEFSSEDSSEGDSESASDEAKTETAENTESSSESDETVVTENVDGEAAPKTDEVVTETTTTTTEELSPGGTETTTAGLSTDESLGTMSEAPKPVIPLKKMLSAPYQQGGMWVNALYVARQDDTLDGVSKKIFNADKVEELKSINPTYKNRDLKVGDKVYYNSPVRPQDSAQMLTYYEDLNLPPEYYTAQPGDDMKAVSKKLLGHSNSWKEIWATNLDVESKGELTEGTRLRYWNPISAPMIPEQTIAQNTPPPMPENVPPPMANTPPPPPPMEEIPPPPAVAEISEPPPPPPPPADPVPSADTAAASPLDNPDQVMALGLGAILLLAAIALFIIRKKRSKKGIDFQTSPNTQIE
jgi:hypothetical protein